MVFVLVKITVGTGSIVCRAKHDAGVREQTLHFYKRPILFKTTTVGQFMITNQDWQEELKDATSTVYNDLRKKCIKIIESAYNGLPNLAGVKIKEFLKGSIIVRFELEVIGQVSDPLLPLKDYIKRQGGEIDGLQIDNNSIQTSSDVQDNSPIPVPEDNQTIASVLGPLFALSVVVNLLFIVSFIWLRRKDSRGCFEKRSNDSDERGQTNEISLQETSLKDDLNVSEYEPIERRGLAASNANIPEYEAVTIRTKPQIGLRTTPQYENTDRYRLPGVGCNTPPRIYQNIQPHTGDYSSLSPSTRHPVKVLPPTGGQTRTGEYQAVQHKSVRPQYQALEDLTRC